ncbi:hypothetical protein ACQR05_25980 [Bradyrhizobium oligotrophicum]|uniref:hypothetical protein n=1 Tax=Bradyrhizobium oligotrophicum TaxID=44255 RepID=UPI003EB7E2AC
MKQCGGDVQGHHDPRDPFADKMVDRVDRQLERLSGDPRARLDPAEQRNPSRLVVIGPELRHVVAG